MDKDVKENLERAKRLVESWPDWKKEFTITQGSLRDNKYAKNKDSRH